VGHRLLAWKWVWLPLSFFLLGSAWAVSSPVASAPDDDYHLASIWCAQGDRDQACQDTGLVPQKFIVAAGAVNSAFCFATKPDVTGDCTRSELNSTEMILTDRVNNIQQLYPGGYYRVMSVFVGSDVEKSVYLMRLFSVFMVSALMAALIRLVPNGIRQATLVAIAVTFIPLGMFLVASTNPSGWAIAGTLYFFAFGLALLYRSSWRRPGTWVIAVALSVSAIMAMSSRVDSAAFLSVAAVAVFALAGRRRIVGHVPASVLLVVLAVAGAVTYFLVTPIEASGELGTSEQTSNLLWTNLVELPYLVQGIVGGWPLGWNDTPLPAFISVIGLLVIGAIAYVGLSHLWVNKGVALAVTFLAFIGFPLVFMQTQGISVGEVVQSRYLLPLFSVLITVIMISARVKKPIQIRRFPAILIALGLWISSSLAIWANAHRYSSATADTSTGVSSLFSADIVWSYGPPLVVTTTVAVLAGAVFVAGIFGRIPGGSSNRHEKALA
jgi:hypothetical protein